jgi:hypothetical protein
LDSEYGIGYGYDAMGRFISVSFTNRAQTSHVSYSYLPNADLIAQLDRDTGGQVLQTVFSYERNLISQVLKGSTHEFSEGFHLGRRSRILSD